MSYIVTIMITNNTYDKIVLNKPDYSSYLFHFTTYNNLLSILKDNKIKKMDNSPISFTESTIDTMKKILPVLKKVPTMNFDYYGIAVNKRYLFTRGARPAFYCTEKELETLQEDFKWRAVYSDLDSYDVTWQREWRCNEDLQLDFDNCLIMVKDEAELSILFADDPDIKMDDGYAISKRYRTHKGIAIEDINDNSDIALCDIMQDKTNYITVSIGKYSE